jgi:DNA-binding NarL/FixJ family response regulator
MEYRVRGTAILNVGAGAGDEIVVVWVRRSRPQQMTPEALTERYKLTARQVHVAALIAAGSGSREIAEALGISPHTARRHTEAVLRKLGLHSRSDVREGLRE